MGTLQKIVVGHSFFPDGDIALRSAITLAEHTKASLYILHVVEPYPLYQKMRFPSVPTETLLQEVVLKMQAQLSDMVKRPPLARLQTTTDVVVGKPFLELIRTCQRFQGDLLVVGTSARGKNRFLGSTGERVLRKAQVPVLITKREFSTVPQTILVPTDFSTYSTTAVQEAISLARSFSARVVFLHVIDLQYIYPSVVGGEPMMIPPVTAEDLEPEWQEFAKSLSLEGVIWEKRTEEGRAATKIAEIAKETGAELIVIGTHGRTGIPHILLGSVAESVLRLAECSVLTIRPSAFQFEMP